MICNFLSFDCALNFLKISCFVYDSNMWRKKSDDYHANGYSKPKSDLQIGFYNHVCGIPTLSVTAWQMNKKTWIRSMIKLIWMYLRFHQKMKCASLKLLNLRKIQLLKNRNLIQLVTLLNFLLNTCTKLNVTLKTLLTSNVLLKFHKLKVVIVFNLRLRWFLDLVLK